MHPNVPYAEGPEIILTCGSTDGFAKSIEALTNIWTEGHMLRSDREGVFVEEFSYMTAIETVLPRGLNIVPVALDAEGMRPKGKGGLRDVLENWDQSRGKVPHLLYTVTFVPRQIWVRALLKRAGLGKTRRPASLVSSVGRKSTLFAPSTTSS